GGGRRTTRRSGAGTRMACRRPPASRRSASGAEPSRLVVTVPRLPARTLPCLMTAVTSLLIVALAAADPVTVRFPEGTTHGFLILRSRQGQTLAHGELTALPKGDRMESRLTWRFRDGSLQDEWVTYLQKPALKLLSYKQIQRGPSFPADVEVAFTREPSRYEV